MTHRVSRCFGSVFCVAAMMLIFFSTSALAEGTLHVIKEVKHDVSPPLAELVRMTPLQPNPFSMRLLKVLPTGPGPEVPQYAVPDAALQQTILPTVDATLGLNFEGLGLGQYGFVMQAAPPDTEGVVGATQYVQWVNLEFAVFDKSTGALVAGPNFGNTLWAGFGAPCENTNDGDPIVQYDKIANRWTFTQFSVMAPPFTQCVAVSTTSDATGTYKRYAFSFGNNFNDYPKMGVWPDAYYISFNMFANGSTFIGPAACAMDRNQMLAGQAATMICFQQSATNTTLLPSDMDGTIQPAAGEPAFFMNFGTNSLELWKFHADFTTPANSTFSGPTILSVAGFTRLGPVPQPGTTQKLDSLSDRLMYRLAYRRFADGHESLVVNHSIATGVRWYEIRNPNGTPGVFQQGTFSPDTTKRWMGSIAMDKAGDIALGYSASSTAVFPSIFFTGRVPGDPAGTMETEQLIVNGTGSQTGGLSRWGDYSDMSVDPVDDCTFWYTQEYEKVSGSFNWNTRIANFKFPNCGGGGGTPAVSLSGPKLNFKKVPVGQTSGPLSVTLFNTGNATLNISSITASGDYAISNNTCGAQVAVGTNCKVNVTFTPTKKGARSGTLSFNDDAAGSPQTVALVGTGTLIALSPTSLNFGTVTVATNSAPQNITLTNVGTVLVTFTSFGFSGTAAADYVISSNSCGATLAGGATCTVGITFHPTVKTTRKANFVVKDNGGGGSQTAALVGVGG